MYVNTAQSSTRLQSCVLNKWAKFTTKNIRVFLIYRDFHVGVFYFDSPCKHTVKKHATKLLSMSLLNIDRYIKLFHYSTLLYLCSTTTSDNVENKAIF